LAPSPRTRDRYTATIVAEGNRKTVPRKTGRQPHPCPLVITSATNLIQLQKQLKGVVKENFQFWRAGNGKDVLLLLLLLLLLLQMEFYRWQWYYNKAQHTHNTAQKATQTIKDTLHAMNTVQI
jgi:hypothetical protein